ncbi:UDP-2,4-diacetamido-2,4,6-trideoxy-beta-L-altropyranose hydrolase [Noviherbaspirillum galbum]|uniref:UDP-2,4-diacetamido-2,4, 6-trideoxy-beta-L-altropyranose hydrolase n=1 Tax=Noviherbaspirillum galbum TaxID=2709383 RepID=A0A6B3SMQ3_9BURK|nr:UDP-2,4-diacetamido-2,4,6-trideoxy-beta-L-altropyranose hydrolase [Noviherbaspirillum galbum]NEX59662.1 UDP-2,4-diacetamido-2,4,6-trideoxy-beta-L-altropyranose hydrolase [Noviherbaspirillum galbum]
MLAVIRTDASLKIGSGHVMRCLTLADQLRLGGAEVIFISRLHPGHLCDLVAGKDYPVVRLPSGNDEISGDLFHSGWLGVSQQHDAEETISALAKMGGCDWLIADHYGIDARWESAARKHARHLLVLDDLADRSHQCDLLLDQGMNPGMDHRYAGMVPAACGMLTGPAYALLRPEFAQARKTLRTRDGTIRRIFVFFGGIDADNETGKALLAIAHAGSPEVAVDVVIGRANPHAAALEAQCADLPGAILYRQVDNIAELMARADLAIGAGGGAMLERCCLGLPSLLISVAANQEPGSEAAARSGNALYLGRSADVSVDLIAQAIALCHASPGLLAHLGQSASALVDGHGARRVARRLLAGDISLRRARPQDCADLHQWRNHESTRRFSGDGQPIEYAVHASWFEKTLANPDRVILIGEQEGHPVGVLRYDREGTRATVSVYLVPGQQGKGLGPELLRNGNEWIAGNWHGVEAIDAWIKPENHASRSAFQDAGYEPRYEIYSKRIRSQE